MTASWPSSRLVWSAFGRRVAWGWAWLGLICALSTRGQAGLEADLETQIGSLAAEALEAETGVFANPAVTRWVSALGTDVARVSRRHDLQFRFRVLDSAQANALALPGGYIYVYRGLLGQLSSERELVGVLAHEVAHLHDRHFQRMLERQLLALGIIALVRRHNSRALQAGVVVLDLVHSLRQSRKHEAQADAVGVQLAVEAGHDPAGILSFLQRISAGAQTRDWLGSVLATHPEPRDRLRRATELVRQAELADYDRLMALACRLQERGYAVRPLELYGVAATLRPGSAEPHWLRANLLASRGFWREALVEYEQAVRLSPEQRNTDLETLRDRLHAAGTEVEEEPSAFAEPLAHLESRLAEVGRDALAVRRRMGRVLRSLESDQRIHQALTYGQVLDGEWSSARYMSTLAGAWLLLRRCLRWSDEAWELARRENEVRGSLGRLAGLARSVRRGADQVTAEQVSSWLIGCGEATAAGLTKALRSVAGQAEQVRVAAVDCAVVLLALMGTGRDDPLGCMTWTRFAVHAAQLDRARENMKRAEAVLDAARAELAAAGLRTLERELDWEGSQAPWRPSHPYAPLLARWVGLSEDQLLARWHEDPRLGAVLRRACQEHVGDGAQGCKAEAEYMLVRLAGMELRTEKLPASWSNGESGSLLNP